MVIFKTKWFPVVMQEGKRRKTKKRAFREAPEFRASGERYHRGLMGMGSFLCSCMAAWLHVYSWYRSVSSSLSAFQLTCRSNGKCGAVTLHRRSWKHNIRALTDVQMFNAMVLWEGAFRIGMNMNDGWWMVGWLQNIWWYYLAELGMMTIDDQYCNQNANVQLPTSIMRWITLW